MRANERGRIRRWRLGLVDSARVLGMSSCSKRAGNGESEERKNKGRPPRRRICVGRWTSLGGWRGYAMLCRKLGVTVKADIHHAGKQASKQV